MSRMIPVGNEPRVSEVLSRSFLETVLGLTQNRSQHDHEQALPDHVQAESCGQLLQGRVLRNRDGEVDEGGPAEETAYDHPYEYVRPRSLFGHDCEQRKCALKLSSCVYKLTLCENKK